VIRQLADSDGGQNGSSLAGRGSARGPRHRGAPWLCRGQRGQCARAGSSGNRSGVYARPIKGSQDRPLLSSDPYCAQSDGHRLVLSDGRVKSVNVDGTGSIEHGEGDCPVVPLGNLYLAKQGRQVQAFGRSEEKGVLVKMTYVAEAKGTLEDFAADATGIYYLDAQRNELMRQRTAPK
jgi:hypothetical protein